MAYDCNVMMPENAPIMYSVPNGCEQSYVPRMTQRTKWWIYDPPPGAMVKIHMDISGYVKFSENSYNSTTCVALVY